MFNSPILAGNRDSDAVDRLEEVHLFPLYHQLKLCASKWKEIGLFLGFRINELSEIQSRPFLFTGAPRSWLQMLIAEWLKWTPGDTRGSTEYASLSALKSAVDRAGLGRIASELKL